MTKIRDVLSDDKKDWELRVAAVRLHFSVLLISDPLKEKFLTLMCCFCSPAAEEGALAAPGGCSRV